MTEDRGIVKRFLFEHQTQMRYTILTPKSNYGGLCARLENIHSKIIEPSKDQPFYLINLFYEPSNNKTNFVEGCSRSILSEALAKFTRITLNLNEKRTDYLMLEQGNEIKQNPELSIVGIPDNNSPYELLEILCDEGVDSMFNTLIDWKNQELKEEYNESKERYPHTPEPRRLESPDELVECYHFSWLSGGSFPSDLCHYFGYALGDRLSHVITDERSFKPFSEFVFAPNKGTNKNRLDKIINLYNALKPLP